jgi:cytochrome c oxidase subunit 3/cytochrome o ubiquinol oxidase subunit 3
MSEATPADVALAQAPPPPLPPDIIPEKTLTATQWGMAAFLLSEAAFFATLIVAYIAYIGKDAAGSPTPAQTLSLPLVLFTTACLLTSSFTIHLAEHSLRADSRRAFALWWMVTIALGLVFVGGTAYEWYGLLFRDGLTVSTNLFGTTFYTLVGFHGLHVSAGLVALTIVLNLSWRTGATGAVQLVSWYWHFVDGVWVVVFCVVYLVGRAS